MTPSSISGRFRVSMMPMPRPWLMPGMYWPNCRCGFIRVAGSRNHTRTSRAACVAYSSRPVYAYASDSVVTASAEPSEVVAIGDLADLGIALAVLADVRLAVRLGRIRPPIRRLAHVVVPVAARRRDRLVHHGHRLDRERLLRLLLERRDRRRDRRVAFLSTRTHVVHVRAVEQQGHGGFRVGRITRGDHGAQMLFECGETGAAIPDDQHRHLAVPDPRKGLAGAVVVLRQRRPRPLARISSAERIDGYARAILAIERGVSRHALDERAADLRRGPRIGRTIRHLRHRRQPEHPRANVGQDLWSLAGPRIRPDRQPAPESGNHAAASDSLRWRRRERAPGRQRHRGRRQDIEG